MQLFCHFSVVFQYVRYGIVLNWRFFDSIHTYVRTYIFGMIRVESREVSERRYHARCFSKRSLHSAKRSLTLFVLFFCFANLVRIFVQVHFGPAFSALTNYKISST